KDAEPTEFEETVAQAFFDLENTNQELKSDLKDLYINSAVQVDVLGNRKAVIIHVPYRLRKAFRKIHTKLVRELEKKFSGKDVVLIATRRIVRPPKKGSAAQRPRSRTLTSVHEAMLEDIVLPAEIVGKRVRYRIDGSKIMKVTHYSCVMHIPPSVCVETAGVWNLLFPLNLPGLHQGVQEFLPELDEIHKMSNMGFFGQN
ncbi:hypothetical protein F2P56_034478, partial [Juglans regia]